MKYVCVGFDNGGWDLGDGSACLDRWHMLDWLSEMILM